MSLYEIKTEDKDYDGVTISHLIRHFGDKARCEWPSGEHGENTCLNHPAWLQESYSVNDKVRISYLCNEHMGDFLFCDPGTVEVLECKWWDLDPKNNADYTGYVCQTVHTEDVPGEPGSTRVSDIEVYVMQEAKDEDPLCENCYNGEPAAVGMRYWVNVEVAQIHDWPHSNLTFCGLHMRELAEMRDDPENKVFFHHFNSPFGEEFNK